LAKARFGLGQARGAQWHRVVLGAGVAQERVNLTMGDRAWARLPRGLLVVLPLACSAWAAAGCSSSSDVPPSDGVSPPDGEDVGVAESKIVTPTCLTIRRGVSGAVADTQIANGDPTRLNKNYGASAVANSGVVPSAGARQALFRFDVSAVPASAFVTSAVVSLTESFVDVAATVRVHGISANWQESTVTWASFGGAFAPAVSASFANGGPPGTGVVSFSVAGLAQGWVASATANHGVLLEQDPVGVTQYQSSEVTVAAQRPKLDICWVIPTCSDGYQDQGEKGVDCGGPCLAECPHPAATEMVNSGDTSKSPHYKAVYTLGQPTQNQDKSTSPSYRVQGGLIGANGSLP
jgi:hypothetical protein